MWADRFLEIHRSMTGHEHHPYWDLLDAADAVGDMPVPRDTQEARSYLRFEEYVAAVVERL